MKRFFKLFAVCFALFIGACSDKKTETNNLQEIVVVKNGKFYKNKLPYFIKGCNYWYGGYLAKTQDTTGHNRLKLELDFFEHLFL